jgi:hypothetical protein
MKFLSSDNLEGDEQGATGTMPLPNILRQKP